MSAITDLTHDERTARMLLSILAEPDDSVTGRVLPASVRSRHYVSSTTRTRSQG